MMEERTMKMILLLHLTLFLLSISAKAQVMLNIYQKGGFVNQYEINNIDSLGITGLSVKQNPDTTATTVFDIDGNGYHTVTIGTQVWMVENLKTTKYRDGSSIPNVNVNAQWSVLTTGAYCDYNNIQSNSTTYGHLYNFYAVSDSRMIAPVGWHVATDAEWAILTSHLGGSVAGGKLKETGTTHWRSPNTGATNESCFSALPGGQRGSSGASYDIWHSGAWWCSTEKSTTNAWHRIIYCNESQIYRSDYYTKGYGLSVRCLKDN